MGVQPQEGRALKGGIPVVRGCQRNSSCPLSTVQRKREALLFQAERPHGVINFALCVA